MLSFLASITIIITVFAQEELTPDNFDSVVDGSKSVFAMFYAPWCGHCKSFKPQYAEVAKAFDSEDSVSIVSVDADAHNDLGSRFGVSGYPTLKFFPQGKKPEDGVEDYSSGRTAEAVVNFINDKAGTRRNVDGSLKRSAGRFPELDILANKFLNDKSGRDAILKELNNICESRETDCKYYLKYASKITDKGDGYANKERDRLQKLAKSDSITNDQRDNFVLRMNVLNGYIEGEEGGGEKEEL